MVSVNGIPDKQDVIDWLTDKIDAERAQANGHVKRDLNPSSPHSDEQVLQKCRSADNAAKFADLFDHGDVHTHHGGDDSVADLALLSMLAFWTQDPVQLERIFSDSALGQREKWRRRHDYRQRTIQKALSDVAETYSWPGEAKERKRNHHRTSLGKDDDDYNKDEAPKPSNIVWFHELGEPKPRRFVIEKVARKGYPLVIYGAGGVAKSFAALAGGIAIASEGGLRDWLGLRVLEHGYVLYLDFELDVDEQHARVTELCNGLGVDVPKRLAYISGRGMDRADVFAEAHQFADEYNAVAVIVDSVGQAVIGDMDKNRDVNEFYRRHIEPFSLFGTTPILVDHEGKRQAGEKHKDKTVIGGVYKTNNARGVLQFILEEYDEDEHRLDIRVRVPKINFEPPAPFGISITFSGEKVVIETRELMDEDLIDEERLPLHKRVYAALGDEELSIKELEAITGAAYGSVRNALTQLGERVESTGTRPARYFRADNSNVIITDTPPGKDGDDYNKNPTVAELFAHPPEWLSKQLKVCRENPDRHFKPLCTAVAAVVLEDGARGPEVAEEVRQAVQPLTTVVNRHSGASYDVYIGRGKDGEVPKTGRGMWGNPFEVGDDKDGTREEVLEKFKRYILEGGVEKYDGTIWDGRHLLEHLPEIRGKVLGCTCVPKPCHGDVLARIADSPTPMGVVR